RRRPARRKRRRLLEPVKHRRLKTRGLRMSRRSRGRQRSRHLARKRAPRRLLRMMPQPMPKTAKPRPQPMSLQRPLNNVFNDRAKEAGIVRLFLSRVRFVPYLPSKLNRLPCHVPWRFVGMQRMTGTMHRGLIAALVGAALVGAAAFSTAASMADAQEWRTSSSLIDPQVETEPFERYSYVNPDAPKGGTLNNAAFGTFDS